MLGSRGPTKIVWAATAVALLAAVFTYNTLQNLSHEDVRDSNFAKFWIAGHMILQGQNPYDHDQWHAAQVQLGATWIPDWIFLYPLPQAYFLVPLALLPAAPAFIVWSLVSQVILAASCFLLLGAARVKSRLVLLMCLVLFMLFFGPTYLTLQVGSIGAIALGVVVAAILLLERRRYFLAGLLLSLLILKPSQALSILFLIGLWFLLRRNTQAILGMLAGGVILLVSGFLYDPLWVQKFLANSGAVSARNFGIQSNIFSFAYLACGRSVSCMWLSGGLAAFLVLALGTLLLWRHRESWTDWQALNVIIPLGFLTAVYLWAYDQLLYAVPIVWIVSRLVPVRRAYILIPLLLLVLDVVSIVALAVQANTKQDLLSIFTTLLVLGLLWLVGSRPRIAPVVEATTPGI